MIPLKCKGQPNAINSTLIGKITAGNLQSSNQSLSVIAKELGCSSELNLDVNLYSLEPEISGEILSANSRYVKNIFSLDHLEIGDIIAIYPSGTVNTLFRIQSHQNSLFITDRCNSNCLMCSQPPRNKDDLDFYYSINSELVKLIPKDTEELGITGGEPTLLGSRLVELLNLITFELPQTSIHILTNGRSFAWQNVVAKLAKVNNPNIIFGIPLYSDYYLQHDYIVQSKNAFSQTVLGFHNMAKYGMRLELRVVLHKQSYKRLPDLSKFIFKNLPFIEHIAFMGLEYTGYTPYNSDKLWIEPSEYMLELEEAVYFLDNLGMNVSIYNLPLCLTSPTLWQFCRNSISDWKRDYTEECNKCNLLSSCGGVFATSKVLSSNIRAILE
jgi:His-Xaa-Ser system radical SAM maturase HxsC